MDKILSVVVPSYNIQKYIKNTVNSFMGEDSILPKIEILIVNDGSSDDTQKLGEEFEKKYPDVVRVVNKENGGHGSTINKGISVARGKYFKVVDGDDWVETGNFIKLISFLEKTDADLILSPYYTYDEGDGHKRRNVFMEGFEGIRNFDDICGGMNKISIHGMIIKTSILRDNNITLDEKLFYVDVEYVCYPLPYVQTAEYFDDPVTVYRIGTNEQSMNKKNLWIRREQHKKVLQSLIRFYEQVDTTEAKKRYLQKSIGAMAEGQYRIYFLGPVEKATKQELKVFDRELKEASQGVYDGVAYKPVLILRKMGFPLFRTAAFLYQKK